MNMEPGDAAGSLEIFDSLCKSISHGNNSSVEDILLDCKISDAIIRDVVNHLASKNDEYVITRVIITLQKLIISYGMINHTPFKWLDKILSKTHDHNIKTNENLVCTLKSIYTTLTNVNTFTSRITTKLDLVIGTKLVDLPIEMLVNISSFLPKEDAIHELGMTCKCLHDAVQTRCKGNYTIEVGRKMKIPSREKVWSNSSNEDSEDGMHFNNDDKSRSAEDFERNTIQCLMYREVTSTVSNLTIASDTSQRTYHKGISPEIGRSITMICDTRHLNIVRKSKNNLCGPSFASLIPPFVELKSLAIDIFFGVSRRDFYELLNSLKCRKLETIRVGFQGRSLKDDARWTNILKRYTFVKHVLLKGVTKEELNNVLKGNKNLESLHISLESNSKKSLDFEDTIRNLKNKSPNLLSLCLLQCDTLSLTSFLQAVMPCKNLRHLSIHHPNDEFMKVLHSNVRHCKKLKVLNLQSSGYDSRKITMEDCKKIVNACPSLKVVSGNKFSYDIRKLSTKYPTITFARYNTECDFGCSYKENDLSDGVSSDDMDSFDDIGSNSEEDYFNYF